MLKVWCTSGLTNLSLCLSISLFYLTLSHTHTHRQQKRGVVKLKFILTVTENISNVLLWSNRRAPCYSPCKHTLPLRFGQMCIQLQLNEGVTGLLTLTACTLGTLPKFRQTDEDSFFVLVGFSVSFFNLE